MNYNRVILSGNLTRKPELKSLDNGTVITSLTIAINQVWKDASGNTQQNTDFLDVTVFGKQAESCAQYLDKGQTVMVEGRLKNRAIEDRGEKRYKTGVLADHVTFGRKSEPKTTEESSGGLKVATAPKKTVKSEVNTTVPYPEDDINPDDIPF